MVGALYRGSLGYYAVAALGGAGLGLAIGVPVYAFLRWVVAVFLSKKRWIGTWVNRKEENKRSERRWGKSAETGRTPGPLLPAMLGGLTGAGFALGTPFLLPAVGLGMIAGMMGMRVFARLKAHRSYFVRLREAAVIYECVDIYTRAGFNVPQALELTLSLVSALRPALQRCLDRWPAGPLQALSALGEEIGVKEADVLIGVLMQAQEAGVEKISGILEQEALRLEDLRKALAEARVAAKPVYATIYTFFPLAAVLGMVIGPLAFRAVVMIASLQAGGF